MSADEHTATAPPDKYLSALQRFAGAGDTRMAKSVVASMRQRGVPVEEPHYRMLLRAFLARRELEDALALVDEMRAAGIEVAPSVRYDIAIAYVRSGRAGVAARMIDVLEDEGHTPSETHEAGILGLHVARQDFTRARASLRRMAERGQQAQPHEYRAILGDLLERRAINDTFAVVEAMLAAGRPPTTDEATKLVSMMARAGHPDRGEQLLEQLVAGSAAVDEAAYDDLLRGYAKTGQPDAVRALLDRMDARGIEVTSFHRNNQLRAQIGSGDAEAAWTVAARIHQEGRIPAGDNLEGLVDVSLAAGNVTLASGAIDWMLMLGVPAPAPKVGQVVHGHLQQGELDLALWLYRETSRRGTPGDRGAARGLVETMVRAGRLDQARELLDELRKSKTLTHGHHYGSLIGALLKRDREDGALDLLVHMLAHRITPSTSDASRVVGAYTRKGKLDRALQAIDQLAEKGVTLNEDAYRDLIWAFAKKNKVDETRAVLDRMTAAGITPDDRHEAALRWASGETARRLTEEGEEGEEGAAEVTTPSDETPPQEEVAPEPAAGKSPAEEPAAAAAEEPRPVASEEPREAEAAEEPREAEAADETVEPGEAEAADEPVEPEATEPQDS